MASKHEKGVFLSRSRAYIFTILMLFLIISLSVLFQFGDNSLVPRSIYSLIIVESPPDYIHTEETIGHFEREPPAFALSSSNTEETSDQFEPESPPFALSSSNESSFQSTSSCDQNNALIKVFMYDLPPSFHFGLLGWKGDQNPNQIWPNVSNLSKIPKYPGGLNIQHSVEYWLTLDLLSSVSPTVSRPCTSIRVQNVSQADVIFVPFFSSLSYSRCSKIHGSRKDNVDTLLQKSLLKYLESRDEWRRLKGKDHLIMAHHPNSNLVARKHFGSSMLVLADFGRYPVRIANVDKDVIAPYKHFVRRVEANESPSFEERPLLVFFRGGIRRKDGGIIRQKLYYLLKDEKDVHFTFGRASPDGFRTASQGMISSKFCLTMAGDTPSSNRLFDAIASHCVPVIISDDIELPFEDVIDYSKYVIFVQSSDAVKKGYLMKLLRGIKRRKWTQMWEGLKQIAQHFEYQYPSQAGDAVDMIWHAIHRKIYRVHDNGVNRRNRYRMSQKFLSS